MALKVGDKAPEFTLVDAERKERKLSEFSGKTNVLVFFPGAFTGVCTKEMCSFRDSLADFNKMNAQVIAISVDAPAANKAFASYNHLEFPVLSDFTREVSRKYPGIYESFGGVKGLTAAKRSVFVLDSKGVVRYAWITEDPAVEPDYEAVRKAVAAI
jgi:glutaredoxin-dependent peroxiredoxin